MCVCVCVSVSSLHEPNMSLYALKLQLSPSICLHLLCLLLLLHDSSSTVARKDPGDEGGASENAAVPDSSETNSTKVAMAPPQTYLHSVSVGNKSNDTAASSIPPSQPAGEQPLSKASPSNQQPEPAPPQLPVPETVTTGSPLKAALNRTTTSPGTAASTTEEPVRNPHTTATTSTTSTSTTSTTTTTTTPTPNTTTTTTNKTTPTPSTTLRNTPTPDTTTTAPVPPTPATTATSTTAPSTTAPSTTTSSTTAPSPTAKSTTTTKTTTPPSTSASTAAAPPNPTRKVTASIITTATTKKNPPPSSPSAATTQPDVPNTELPPVHTTSSPTAVVSTVAPADHDRPVGSKIPVVEVAGAALTRKLADTASLLAILLFGLLFFLVTVAVFVTQAYESYRRKDYTQVDYLINGMYTDSGV